MTATVLSDYTYIVGYPTQTFSHSSYSTSPYSCSDSSFTYAATQTSPTVGSIPTFLTYSSNTFSIYTASIANEGTYTIQVNGTAANGKYTSFTFDLIVSVTCYISSSYCTSCALATQTYTAGNSALTFNFPTLYITVEDCVPTYTISY